MSLSRRRFLATATTAAAAAHPAAKLLGQAAANEITLDLTAPATGPHIPADFVGLSYEIQQLTDPAFFSVHNTGLIREFRNLAPHGVLRLGGNTSEFAWWKPTPTTPEPEHPKTKHVEGEPLNDPYPVTAEAVRNLAGFLQATGWTCLYGINLGTNTPARAADEAAFVAKTLGRSLQYFQIGNEVDMFDRHLRDPKTWSVQAYLDEWLAIAHAITAAVPNAKFGIPDVASKVDWLTQIADKWSSLPNPPAVTTLSHHYYFGGPATNPAVNIPALLKQKPSVLQNAHTATAAAAKIGARVRMTEGNTCYRGGKPGVSDVFAAALWAADYALTLAANGYSGINLHGGTGKSVANSVGGFLPGDVMLKDAGQSPAQIATHPHPFYTPIGTFPSTKKSAKPAGVSADTYLTEPVGYGLKFAGSLSGATLIPVTLNAGEINATAYAAKTPSGHISVIVINKDADKDLPLTLNFGAGKSGAILTETLHAPSLESREAHITGSPGLPHPKAGKYTVTIPKATAMRFTLA